MKSLMRMSILVVALILASSGSAGANENERDGNSRSSTEFTWSLPAQPRDRVIELAGSADGLILCFTTIRYPRGGASTGIPAFTCWMLDTETGKITDLSAMMNKKLECQAASWSRAVPSQDGKHILLTGDQGMAHNETVIYVLATSNGAVRKLAQGDVCMAVWSGDVAYISSSDANGRLGPIGAYQPSREDVEAIEVHGLVVAAAPDGAYLVAACDPDALGERLAAERLDSVPICIVHPPSKVVAKLVKSLELSQPPEISPNGKYLVFGRQQWFGDRRPPKNLGMRVITADGDVQWDLAEGDPVAVTDHGEVVAAFPTDGVGHAAIRLVGPRGDATTLAAAATAAIVRGGKLFYVTPGESKLKAVSVKGQ